MVLVIFEVAKIREITTHGIEYIGHLIKNKKHGPGWISYLREGTLYTNFKTKNRFSNFYVSLNLSLGFLLACFLLGHVYCNSMLTSTEKVFRYFNSKKETPAWHRGSVSYLVVTIEHSLLLANVSYIYMVFTTRYSTQPCKFLILMR